MAADVIAEVNTYRGRCRITTVSGRTFVLPKVMLRKFPLRAGDDIDVEEYLNTLRQAERPECMNRAAWLLSRHDYSAQMLRQKLVEAGFGEATAEHVVDYLQEARYVDDDRYAANLVSRRVSKRGARQIAHELRLKGIDEPAREKALEAITEEQELHHAVLQLRKYLRGKSLERQDAFRRCVAYLARRGYSYELAKRAYEEATGDLEAE